MNSRFNTQLRRPYSQGKESTWMSFHISWYLIQMLLAMHHKPVTTEIQEKPCAGSGAVRIGPAQFPGRKSQKAYQIRCRLFLLATTVFLFLFCVWVYVLFCFLVFGCQYQCNRLPGKVSLRYDLLCVEWDVKPYSLIHSLTEEKDKTSLNSKNALANSTSIIHGIECA